jgi:hypothetical protein
LRSDNLQLRGRIDTLTQRPSAPDDFASAIQQSVDELQQRMANMKNAMSNFAVRELKLDASVFVQVSPVGSIEYRFVQPGDNIEAAAVSRLSLDIVPVPRNDLAGVWTPNLFQPELPISALPEITLEQTRALEGEGLFSIGEFLQVGTRARASLPASSARHRAQPAGAMGTTGRIDDIARRQRRRCLGADRSRIWQLRYPGRRGG